jgi:hypothetical protein
MSLKEDTAPCSCILCLLGIPGVPCKGIGELLHSEWPAFSVDSFSLLQCNALRALFASSSSSIERGKGTEQG